MDLEKLSEVLKFIAKLQKASEHCENCSWSCDCECPNCILAKALEISEEK